MPKMNVFKYAKECGVHPVTIFEKIDNGKIIAFLEGEKIFIDTDINPIFLGNRNKTEKKTDELAVLRRMRIACRERLISNTKKIDRYFNKSVFKQKNKIIEKIFDDLTCDFLRQNSNDVYSFFSIKHFLMLNYTISISNRNPYQPLKIKPNKISKKMSSIMLQSDSKILLLKNKPILTKKRNK